MRSKRMRISTVLASTAMLLNAIFLSACGHLEKQSEANGTPPSLTIPFQRHVLDNGLTVILHEDTSDPIVHVDVTYHVGSAREELGKSGFAHLFEHMMFQGSEHVADEEHIKIITEAGGTMNGTTSRDRTNYFETVPSSHLETALWLEADRMGFFLNAITQEKFEIQRATVKNEKQQNYDNRAYGRAFEFITKTLYPYGHPYSWLTIGDIEDLDRVDVQDLRNFFLRWYGPNNATLTIGGDFDHEEALALVEKYFGGIARGPEVHAMTPTVVGLDSDRYISYYDDKIRFPAVTLSFFTVPKFHPDAPALQCLAEILGKGKGSYLYQNLVAPRKAIQASASNRSDELAGEFFMFVLPFPGQTLADFEIELRTALEQFEENGVSDEDLQKFKASYEKNFVNGLEKVSGKVSRLAYYETFANDADFLTEDLNRHLAVTKADVMRVYNRYIKNQPAVILSVLADPDGTPAKPDNYMIPAEGEHGFPSADYSGLEYIRAQDNFDRSIRPSPKPTKLASPPKYWTASGGDNVRIIGTKSDELPKIVFKLSLHGGYALDTLALDKLGLASLTADMLNTSTLNYSEKEIAEELEKIGSSIHISAGAQRFNIHVSTLTKNIDRTLELLEEKLFRPAFKPEDFARLQNLTIESAKSSTKQASSIASMVYNRLIYGDRHIFGIPEPHVVPTLSKLTVEDTRQFYENYFSPHNAELVVVGDISKRAFLKKLDFIFDWENAPAPDVVHPTSPAYDKTTLFLVDKKGAAQSEIRIGYLTELPYDATGEFYRRYLMNFTLGGAFNSRINLNLREEKGLTYGAHTWFDGSEIPGPFTASTSVKSDGTHIAVKEIMAEINLMQTQGITEEELHFLSQAVGQRDALKYESGGQKSGFLNRILRYDVDRGFAEKQKNIIANLSKQEVDRLARKHLPSERMLILVVGDKEKIYQELSELGYPIVELNEEGTRL